MCDSAIYWLFPKAIFSSQILSKCEGIITKQQLSTICTFFFNIQRIFFCKSGGEVREAFLIHFFHLLSWKKYDDVLAVKSKEYKAKSQKSLIFFRRSQQDPLKKHKEMFKEIKKNLSLNLQIQSQTHNSFRLEQL